MTIIDEEPKVIVTKLEDEFYLDEEEADKEEVGEGTEVARGSYVVPSGVVVETLKNYSGHKALRDECPEDVLKFLEEKMIFDVYDRLVTTLAEEKNTRGFFGKWKDAQFISVLDQFRDEFTAKGIKVVLCKRGSQKGSFRWLEFIDVESLKDPYVPQYDVSNLSGQIIKTVYTKLKFPNGVAVEELKQWKARKKLKEKIPIYVEKMLEKYDLIAEYNQMVDRVIESGGGSFFKNWDIEKLKDLSDEYKSMFSAKGIDIFVSHKQEWVGHGQGGHYEYFRWIEFVDRNEQPNYFPQRDADTKDEKCTIM